ncbi:MAG: hypothetical protein KGJ41_15460 [Rhodospirillales bacterium]|nr:hypothetical protein [Rhodospirillales bacterium]MDE2575870.1 hypothetical protein [Rhodospirillales bacterium]
MTAIVLINPNTAAAALAMMLEVAAANLPAGMRLRGVSAAHGAAMIVDEAALAVAPAEVERLGPRRRPTGSSSARSAIMAALAGSFGGAIVEPVPAAMRRVLSLVGRPR